MQSGNQVRVISYFFLLHFSYITKRLFSKHNHLMEFSDVQNSQESLGSQGELMLHVLFLLLRLLLVVVVICTKSWIANIQDCRLYRSGRRRQPMRERNQGVMRVVRMMLTSALTPRL